MALPIIQKINGPPPLTPQIQPPPPRPQIQRPQPIPKIQREPLRFQQEPPSPPILQLTQSRIKSYFNRNLQYLSDRISQIDICNTYRLSDLKILYIPSGNPLNYNACLVNDRLFFRSVKNIGEDDIMTCKIENFKYVLDSVKILSLSSSFNNNKHVEDPRVILHKDNYFVCYTDGYNIGIAKLDLECNTIYSHYLSKPDGVNFEGGDGREKNWLPISNGDYIDFWYGDSPRTFLKYYDTGTSLKFCSYLKTSQRVKSNFGNIRGGCAPIDYDDNGIKIWFFHTLFRGKYRIGAYLTKGLDIIKITPQPILSGNHIVFPCGAIQCDGDFYISMGIQDKDIGILKVSRDLEFVDV